MNSQNIQLAKYAGFCYGVKRAVETAKKLKIENPDKNIYVLGGRYFGGTETREHFYQTILVYDVSNDEWHTVGRMEQATENMIAFEYDGDLYWGLGQCEDGSFVRKIYRRDMRIEN